MKVTNKLSVDAKKITRLAAFVSCGAVLRGHRPSKHGVFSRMMRNKRKSGSIFFPESIHGNSKP